MNNKGFKDALPVMVGYFPIAVTFGILSESTGIEIIDGVMMSAFVFAGASQFMAISMISAGIGISSIIFATFFMNFRHFIMSISLKSKIDSVHKKYYPLIGFFLTDETFSVLSMKNNMNDGKYLITFQASCYASWVLGTLTGYLAGMFLPQIIINSLGIALYALFVALIVPSCKKSTKALILTILAGIINSLIQKNELFNQSSSFIITVLGVSLIATFFTHGKEKITHEC
ncbi:MAG: AzlC family ABC transporter permease [Bacillota bacterium]|nr:AzlC family ABC transporter permease [Bacillota bacterium]